MKTRLLKKLREKYYLEQRNKEFRVYKYTDSGTIIHSDWMSLKKAIGYRRELILKEAREDYKVAKKSYVELNKSPKNLAVSKKSRIFVSLFT